MNTVKKIMMTALAVQLGLLILSTQVHGQAKKTEPTVILQASAQPKTEIKKEELPEAARNLLAGSGFKDWTVNKAYRVKTKSKDANGKEIEEYEVEVKKDNTSQVLLFDKDGNVKTKEES